MKGDPPKPAPPKPPAPSPAPPRAEPTKAAPPKEEGFTKLPAGLMIGGHTGDVDVTSPMEAGPEGDSVPLVSTDRLRLFRGEMEGFQLRCVSIMPIKL